MKSPTKEEHDREMLVDDMHYRTPTPSELAEDQVFRMELCVILRRIAMTLEDIQNTLARLTKEY